MFRAHCSSIFKTYTNFGNIEHKTTIFFFTNFWLNSKVNGLDLQCYALCYPKIEKSKHIQKKSKKIKLNQTFCIIE